MTRSERITIDDIWNLTSGGEDIFAREMKISFSRNVSAPWRPDSVPSVRLKKKRGIVYYTDYGGDQTHGNAIDFLMKLYNLSFVQALDKIKADFNIKDRPKEYKRAYNKGSRSEIIKPEILYEFNDMPFTRKHHQYWNRYFLSEDFVREEGDVYAVRKWAKDKIIQKPTEGEIVFCYVFRDEQGNDTGKRKFLRIGPNVAKEDKWRTSVPNNAIWYKYKYINKNTKQLFIAKSNKDALCLMKQGINSVATQSENDVILSKNIPDLKKITQNLVIAFGSDPQGCNASINVTREFNLKWFNTNKEYLKYGINDPAEFVKEFGEICLRQLLINKNFI